MPPDSTIHILAVEDQTESAEIIRIHLEHSGYRVTIVQTGALALSKVKQHRYDLLLLDIGLPDISGFDVLYQLRMESYDVPVLILSAQVEIEDRVRGLKLGADDYLIKPYDPRELLARIETVLKRNANRRSGVLQFEDLKVELDNRKVFRRDTPLNLTPKEFSLLVYFLQHPSEVIPRQRLIEEVWGMKFDPGTNIVDVNVSRLRKSINEGFEKQFIRTVHGEGFILKTGL